METIEKSARILSLNGIPPAEDKKMYKLMEGDTMLLFSPEVFAMCKNKELSKVIFLEEGSLVITNKVTKEEKKFRTFKVTDVVDSELTQLTETTKLEDARLEAEFKVKNKRAKYLNELKALGGELV